MMNLRRTLIFAVTALLPALVPLSAYSADKAGDVVSLQGTAAIERQAKKIPAKLKTPLLEADTMVTMKDSRVKMLFRDDSVLTLGASSRLLIKQYLYSPESGRAETIYELADGRMRAVASGAGFTVTTPTAVTAADGAVFIIWYDSEKNSTGIAVIEGSVSVRHRDEAIADGLVLEAGQMTFVPAHEPTTKPVPFKPEAEMERDTELYGVYSDVNTESPPALLVPPPVIVPPAVNSLVRIIPIAPPIAQTTRRGTTPVNLNLPFP
jgi:hypothetical protein